MDTVVWLVPSGKSTPHSDLVALPVYTLQLPEGTFRMYMYPSSHPVKSTLLPKCQKVHLPKKLK